MSDQATPAAEVQQTPREQLTAVSQRLENLNVTRVTIAKLMELNAIKIVQGTAPEEGQEPLNIDVSGDIVATILSPVLNVVNRRREEFLQYKEQLLAEIEKQVLAGTEAK
jgi:hypothetical protein